jgi:phosphoribosylamine-glycine ligase
MKYFVSNGEFYGILNFCKNKNILVSRGDPALKIAHIQNWNVEKIRFQDIEDDNNKKRKEKTENENEEKQGETIKETEILKRTETILFMKRKRKQPKPEHLKWDELPEHEFSTENLYFWDGNIRNDINLKLRLKGFKIFGGHPICHFLEYDRIVAKQYFEKLNIPTPAFEVALSVDEAIKILNKISFKKAVLKPSANISAITTLIAPPKELASFLEENRTTFEKAKNFIIEEFKEGVEISCERYKWGNNIGFFNFTIEAKKFLAGNLGVNTGSEFNIVFGYDLIEKFASYTKNKRKTIEILENIYEELAKTQDLDCEILDINFIIDPLKQEYYALEFTPRIGYLGTLTWAKILKDENIYWDFIPDYLEENFTPPTSKFGFGVRITIPPYPYTNPNINSQDVKVEIESFEETKDGVKIEVSPESIEYDEEENCYYSTGDNLCSVHSTSEKLENLFEITYNFIKENIDAPALQYRIDAESFYVEYLKKL